ncbi:dihydrodipicolinate synthase family protein [Microbacterium immunditiarum]|uniref:Dihydrodipicolinate synthase/N-acetylneuraminate lyase n=1 Tax=Microbacterium immunditiarum TaxID=337480 RepID=A0A7Y9GM52_9MICO|nr:dihydrodipicolinate synthase family protein [Microbacterium immunditiarum]NYE19038.1 dihydrodipicolinate synthase/N-acetylneuraminate lyase [Microbacterium immunditiarum]
MPGWEALEPDVAAVLRRGAVIPAHPLALSAERRLDERRQRALSRYYAAAGAGGIAVGVHTTQFGIREAGLLRPVLQLAAETFHVAAVGRPTVRIAGAAGPTDQAVAEAQLARELGYHAVLLSPGGLAHLDEDALLDRSAAVGEVLPVIGFALQEAVGGRPLSADYWRRLADQPSTIAVKAAPFDRYRTVDLVRGVAASGRADDVLLYTGNDDAIVTDLLTPWWVADASGDLAPRRFAGGLLGHWAVWTRDAVELFEKTRAARDADGDPAARQAAEHRIAGTTDANAAVFDARNGFAGVIAGVHEVLRRQGLLQGIWCLDPHETLSPGQSDELDRVYAQYPWLRSEDEFIASHLDEWLD